MNGLWDGADQFVWSLGLVAYAPMPTEVEHSGTDDRTPRILSIYQRLYTLDIPSKT